MSEQWSEAGGAEQLALMGAASRAVEGDLDVDYPHRDGEKLRFYFHRFSETAGTGTMWVWCHSSKITSHIPRVRPTHTKLRDPFEHLTLEQFAELELDEAENFLDRLDRLWEAGEILSPAERDSGAN
jgi:hypothetical protein